MALTLWGFHAVALTMTPHQQQLSFRPLLSHQWPGSQCLAKPAQRLEVSRDQGDQRLAGLQLQPMLRKIQPCLAIRFDPLQIHSLGKVSCG